MNSQAENQLSELDTAAFKRDGFVVKRGLASEAQLTTMTRVAADHLRAQLAPIEYEVDVGYLGAPLSQDAVGGDTVRRLLHAYARGPVFRDWASSPALKAALLQLLGDEQVLLSQCHHNCIMTKNPGYSSATLWHQDNRYWSFDAQNLVSVWLALGAETETNGCLSVIPGSHRMEFEPGRFDAKLFLRPDVGENKTLIQGAEQVALQRGDVLFFHSRLFHAAGRNLTGETKYSVVFTYHEASNMPIEDTRSAKFPSILL